MKATALLPRAGVTRVEGGPALAMSRGCLMFFTWAKIMGRCLVESNIHVKSLAEIRMAQLYI